jgi:hypothetical protein
MDRIESILQRPKFYNNIDGVGEFGLGFMFLGSALLQWLPIQSPRWHRYGSFLGFLLLITVIHHGSKAIKKHITYPRTGFVVYPRRDAVWIPMILGACASVLIGIGLVLAVRTHSGMIRSHWGMTTPVALAGLIIANSYAYGIARSVRWKWAVPAAMAICSVAIVMLPESAIRAMAGNITSPEWIFGALQLTFMLYGAILLISGGISFVLYLRQTQPAAETGE